MDILGIFKIISILYTVIVIGYGWHHIHDRTARALFVSMLFCFLLSAVLFFPEGAINDWLKHLPFYIAQFLFYFFLQRVIVLLMRGREKTSAVSPIIVASAAIPVDWFSFITQHGLQHIITFPSFFFIVTYIRIQYSFTQSAFLKPLLNIFILAGFCMTMIHIGEFVVESLGWLPMLMGDPIEIIEFVWFYLALGFYWYAVSLLSRNHEKAYSPR